MMSVMRRATLLLESGSFLLNERRCRVQIVSLVDCSIRRSFTSPSFSSSSSSSKPLRPDPLARRPNKICDPYGQGGKPLSRQEAQSLLATIEEGWTLVPQEDEQSQVPPTCLAREFHHVNFLEASHFVGKIAAIGHVNNHYPSILLERRLLSKAWQVVTRIECLTPTLEGLSYNDFHLAMQVDIEIARPEVQQLLLSKEDSQRKIT